MTRAVFWSPTSGGNRQRDQFLGRRSAIRRADRHLPPSRSHRPGDGEAGSDGPDAPGLLFEIPDELAAGTFLCKAPPVFGEHGDARAEQGAAHGRDQGDAAHQLEHRRRVGFRRDQSALRRSTADDGRARQRRSVSPAPAARPSGRSSCRPKGRRQYRPRASTGSGVSVARFLDGSLRQKYN